MSTQALLRQGLIDEADLHDNQVICSRGVDPEQFNPDPDPGNHANSDPDPGSGSR